MVRCLVTGGLGFIGSRLAEYLLQSGYAVNILDKSANAEKAHFLTSLGANVIQGDILDRSAVQKAIADVTYIFHLAAMVSVPECSGDPVGCYRNNVEGTLQILNAAIEYGVKRLVFSSSSAVYGDVEATRIEESLPLKPKSHYGVSKKLGEEVCEFYAANYPLEVSVLRYFNVYGPGQPADSPYSAVIAKFVHNISHGEPVLIHGDGLQTRDFIYVDDVVKANILCAQSEHPFAILNIGTGTGVSILELRNKLSALFDRETPVQFGPPRDGDIRHSVSNPERASKVVGFQASFDFDTGLRRFYETALLSRTATKGGGS